MTLQIKQIQGYLQQHFYPHLQWVEGGPGGEMVREQRLEARGVEALALQQLGDLSPHVACQALHDCHEVNQIGTLYLDPARHTLYLLRSWYQRDLQGPLQLVQLRDFLRGVRELIGLDLTHFAGLDAGLLERIRTALYDVRTRIALVVVSPGEAPLPQDCHFALKEFIDANNRLGESFTLHTLNARALYNGIRGAAQVERSHDEAQAIGLRLLDWRGVSGLGHEGYQGLVSGETLVQLYADHAEALLGDGPSPSGVPSSWALAQCIRDEPEQVWHRFAGVSFRARALCSRPQVSGAVQGGKEGYFDCIELGLSDGAPLLAALNQLQATHPEQVRRVRVSCRLVLDPSGRSRPHGLGGTRLGLR